MNRVERVLLDSHKPLVGVSLYNYSPSFVEIVGHLGFNVLWIEMEHASLSFSQASDLCRIASGFGLLTMIRIPNSNRENVLRAAECGADILDLPMGNEPEDLRNLVLHACYAPEGKRGFFGSSRAVRYGIFGSIAEEQRRVNRDICLMAQVETQEAVNRLDELCGVSRIDAIFIGPGDLSSSFGVTGELNHRKVSDAVDRIIHSAKQHGKRVAVACRAADAARFVRRGADILFCGSDISCLKSGAQEILRKFGNGTSCNTTAPDAHSSQSRTLPPVGVN